jgi:hypothetical protein
MDQQKAISDSILATKDTIFVLQQWLELLESWHALGGVEQEVFAAACQELRENGLWDWANEAGGHGIEALARVVGTQVLVNRSENDDN